MRHAFLFVLLAAAPAIAAAPETPAPAAALLAGTAGSWQGELQYRDYESNSWQGLPMTVTVTVQPDAVTTIRTAAFDDGPKAGIVTITTVTSIDEAAATSGYAAFRKNRAVDVGSARIITASQGADAAHWTIVTLEARSDGDSPAEVRETTRRDGDTMTTLKEVNPVGDGKDVWLPRNRSVLRRTAP